MGWQTNNGKVAKEYADYAKKQADLLAEKQDGLDEIIEVGEFVKGNRVNIEKAITDSTEAKGKSTEAKTTADSVKAQFDRVVAEAGSNNPEVVQARGNEVNLNARFEKVTTQLADTVKKNSIGILGLNVFDEPTRNILQGQAPGTINAVLGEKNVKPENTTFFKNGKNLFNKEKAERGFLISSLHGGVVASANYFTSDFISVSPNTSYTRSHVYTAAFYNSDKVFITGMGPTPPVKTILTPPNTAFVRVSSLNTEIDLFQLEKGNVETPYNKFTMTIDPSYVVIPETTSFNNRISTPTFTNGELAKVEEIEGGVIKKRTTLTYDTSGNIKTVTVSIPGQTLVTTVNYINGEFSSLSNQTFEGGL